MTNITCNFNCVTFVFAEVHLLDRSKLNISSFLKHRSYIYSEIYFHSTCFIGVISTVECTCSKKLKLSVFGLFWLAQKHTFLMQALITQCIIHRRYKFKDSFNLVHSFAIRKCNARAEVDRRSTFSELFIKKLPINLGVVALL